MKGESQPGSYLHPFSFQRYCLGEERLHPLIERHNVVDPKCALQLHELLRMLLVVNHRDLHRRQDERGI